MNLALFDFDGTITTKETWPLFMRSAIPLRRQVVGLLPLAPWLVGYKLGLVPVVTVRSVMTNVGFRGVPEIRVREVGQHFSRTVLPGLIRPMALERIKWHRAQGDIVVVVSASLELCLAEWCKPLGLQLISTQLESRDGVLTGRFLGNQCCGQEKVRRIVAAYNLSDFSTVYGYGDTAEDQDMLSIASKKYYQWHEMA